MIVIGALVEKEAGLKAYHAIYDMIGVDYIFFEAGRSDDIGKDKQFGDFGESGFLTLIAQEHEKDNIMMRLTEICGANLLDGGRVYIGQKLLMSAL